MRGAERSEPNPAETRLQLLNSVKSPRAPRAPWPRPRSSALRTPTAAQGSRQLSSCAATGCSTSKGFLELALAPRAQAEALAVPTTPSRHRKVPESAGSALSRAGSARPNARGGPAMYPPLRLPASANEALTAVARHEHLACHDAAAVAALDPRAVYDLPLLCLHDFVLVPHETVPLTFADSPMPDARCRASVEAALMAQPPLRGYVACFDTSHAVSVSSGLPLESMNELDFFLLSGGGIAMRMRQGATTHTRRLPGAVAPTLCVCVAEVRNVADDGGAVKSCIVRGRHRCATYSLAYSPAFPPSQRPPSPLGLRSAPVTGAAQLLLSSCLTAAAAVRRHARCWRAAHTSRRGRRGCTTQLPWRKTS